MAEQHGNLMSKPMPEFVLCLHGSVPHGLTHLGSPDDLGRWLDPDSMVLMPREQAEKVDNPKQLVAYVVLVRGPHVFCCRRVPGSGEPDLAGKRSVGLGGHVNAEDVVGRVDVNDNIVSVVFSTATREIREEFVPVSDRLPLGYTLFQIWVSSLRLVALVYDPSNKPGRRHVGVVFRADDGGQSEVVLRPGLEPLGWMTPAAVLAADGPPLETWSRIVLEHPEVLELEGTS